MPGSLRFKAIPEYSLGLNKPYRAAYRDLDADGRIDIVTTTAQDDRVAVAFAQPDGSFEIAAEHPTANPHVAALGDVDGDDLVDILTTRTDGDLWLLRGNGDGSFQPPVERTAVDPWLRPVLADIDGDGDLDLLGTGNYDKIFVHLNDGLGNFTEQPDVPLLGRPLLSATDLDGDALADLLIVHTNGGSKHHVQVGLSQGDGTFTLLDPVQVPAMNGVPFGNLDDHTIGDVDGDGRVDVVVVDHDGVSIMLGGPDATFAAASRYDAGEFGSGAALGDWDGDGKIDLAHASDEDFLLYVRSGHGDGTFADPPRTYTTAQACTDLTAGRFDDDARDDIVLGCTGLAVAVSLGDGTFFAAPAVRAGVQPYQSAVGDFNEDGDLDLVVGYVSSEDIAVFPGDGAGEFGAPLSLIQETGALRYVRVADMDADGHLDLVTCAEEGLSVAIRVRLGDGAGNFVDPPVATVPHMVWPEIADIDGDGDLDVVSTGLAGLNILRNDGTGALAPDPTLPADGDGPYTLALADLDQDGDLDVVGGHYELKQIELFWNHGDGTFDPSTTKLPSPATVWRAIPDDFDGDGTLDLLRATFDNDPATADLVVLPGNGDGTFGQAIESPQIYFPFESQVLAADFNNDGRLDLLHTRGNAFVLARLGLGDGTFGEAVSYPFSFAGWFTSGDLDHDDLLDVIISRRMQQKRSHVGVWLNVSE
ncbi:VCBS repeat-containing protein [Nannocystis sp. RBIL2]|uniref:FG-GAP repeat domain-containing protein n=1 Tax=Nannocystis sp. RBIL2 TaxID=2996788 RepID=UPI00226F8FEF|nr:VCBS repeat-containing protein [Nannocystis sp. RBIL2]MCY1072453.1 VCBS repeat-containing protein [Nannocystis sp. RBIL2]